MTPTSGGDGWRQEARPDTVAEIKALRAEGTTVPDIIRQVGLSKASVHRALNTI